MPDLWNQQPRVIKAQAKDVFAFRLSWQGQLHGNLAERRGGPHYSHESYFVLGYGRGNMDMMGVGGTTGFIKSSEGAR